MYDAMKLLEIFLPINLPPSLHHQGFKLWLSEFFGIWDSVYNDVRWRMRIIQLFTRLAWNNIGYIDWEPWLPQIFTRILRGFSLPIGTMQLSINKDTHYVPDISRWIVAMIGNGSSCLQYLRDLLMAIKSFYYPSNTGKFQKGLVEFVLYMAQYFVDRIHLEHKVCPDWHFVPHESYRLTEQDITNFVDCIKEYALLSIFNKDYTKEVAEACQYLAMFRPDSIVPPIVDKLLLSTDNLIEAHRFTSLLRCLIGMTRQLVRQTSSYSCGQTYILPLLMSILPGIDLNDFEKTSVTLDFFDAIFMLISCIDCSSAVHIRNDLNEIEKEVCLSTAKFEDFIAKFLDRIFQMINILSTDVSDAVINNEDQRDYDMLQVKLTSIMTSILQQCSNNIYQMIMKEITHFITGSIFLPKVRKLVAGLVRAMVKCHPIETLKCLLPQTCESIKKILGQTDITLLNDHNGDLELTWYLILFAELVQARGDTLLAYQQMIKSVFHQSIRILHKDSYEAISIAIKHLLRSLLNVYPIDDRLNRKNFDESFVDDLPIRTWGQNVDFNQIQVHYHIPNVDEIDFACDFVNTFIYSELTLLKENFSKISKDERQRSLRIIKRIAVGCFRIVPRIESKQVQDLTWGQKKMALSFLCLLLQKHVPIPSSCIETCLDFLIHDNIELRKDAIKAIAAFCRLQKPPQIYVEKSFKEILHSIDQSVSMVVNDLSQPGDRDDNLWITYNDYKCPKVQREWEQVCFLDKVFHGYYQWPKMIEYPMNKCESYIRDQMPKHVSIIFDRFLDKNFMTKFNKLIIYDEGTIDFNKTRFLMYKGLFRNFGLAFVDNFIEQSYILIREKIQEKYEGSHRAAAEIVAGMIRGSKYWTLEMLDELWQKLTPLLTEVSVNLNHETYFHWGSCIRYCLSDTDPRRMCRPIQFICTLINQQTSAYTFNEASRWYLVQCLRVFQWRIPSVWHLIHEKAKDLLDHPSKWIRERIAAILSISFGLNLTLFDGKSTRHPDANQFIDMIRERLHQAIEIYQKKPLINVSGSSVELDVEARQALNLIETVIDIHSNLFIRSHQPIKEGIICLFPYLCQIESIATNDDDFKKRLAFYRMHIGMAYLNPHLLETLIQQLEHVCTAAKWHARRAAIEFIQNMIFCNLFNVRCHAKRLHELVLKSLFDEQLEVRLIASKTLSGILGLCAIVLSSPYDISIYVPDALRALCKYSYDPYLIQKSIKECMSEFRRTHYDSWHEHRKKFTDEQLEIRTEFQPLKAQVDSMLPETVQAIAIAWTMPSRVECNSITSALALGFMESPCNTGTCTWATSFSYFGSNSTQPFSDLRMRPAMMLAVLNIEQAKQLIDRGMASDGTQTQGSAYIMNTNDGIRNLRGRVFPSSNLGTNLSSYVDVQIKNANWIAGTTDALFIFKNY
ncbi:unnamed protein product [Rotaria sp. Silwood1]|nr:unnamed protein product [Rotaria sp. Silwood1]